MRPRLRAGKTKCLPSPGCCVVACFGEGKDFRAWKFVLEEFERNMFVFVGSLAPLVWHLSVAYALLLFFVPIRARSGRGILRRWAASLEQHAVITFSGTTLQLLDDSNLQGVAAAATTPPVGTTTTSETPSAADGWVGGTWVSRVVQRTCDKDAAVSVGSLRHVGRSTSLLAAVVEAS